MRRILFRAPLCNRRCGTGPCIGGLAFPLCWRCTACAATMIGVGLSGMVIPVTEGTIALAMVLFALAVSDGLRSYFSPRGTTNRNRVVFGAMLGASLMVPISML